MKNRLLLDRIVFFLLIVAGLAWGGIGLFAWNFIGALFGSFYWVTRFIYLLMGAAAVYRLVLWIRAKTRNRV